jgi:hypothetical protein
MTIKQFIYEWAALPAALIAAFFIAQIHDIGAPLAIGFLATLYGLENRYDRKRLEKIEARFNELVKNS